MNRHSEQSLDVTAPKGDGTNNTNMRLLSSGTTHAAYTIPSSWEDKVITFQAYGTAAKSIWFYVSELSTAEVDRSIAASSTGAASPKLGKRIAVGESFSFRIPRKSATSATQYLIHETDDATTTLEMWPSSE